VDVGKPGLHCVDPGSFLVQQQLAIEESERGDPRKGSRYGKHSFTKGYYFCRYNGSYGLCREMGGGGELIALPFSLLERLIDDLGVTVSLEALVGVRMVILHSKFSPNSLGAPTLLSICTPEISPLVGDPVPDLSGPLSPNVFVKNRAAFEGGHDWF
jgi:hypothetical protein